MSGRIVLHLDRGLVWTKPQVVACCGQCGTELARRRDQDTAMRAAGRRRCPGCGTRTARRLPGTTSPTTDLARTQARRRPSPPPTTTGPLSIPASWKELPVAYRSLWQIDLGDGTWAVCCMACRLALYRGSKRTAERVFRGHRCEPVVPLGPRRRRRPA
jgi:hypothetical protein